MSDISVIGLGAMGSALADIVRVNRLEARRIGA